MQWRVLIIFVTVVTLFFFGMRAHHHHTKPGNGGLGDTRGFRGNCVEYAFATGFMTPK